MHFAMPFANPLARRALGAAAVVLTAAACNRADKGATGDTNGGAATDVAAGSSVTAAGNTGETGYVGTIQPVAMRAFTGNVADAQAGRQVFLSYNCVGCHGGLAGGAMGPSLRDDEWKFGGTDEQIMNTLHQGRPAGMPAWKGVIPDPQLRQLIVYMRSLRSQQEPTYFFSPGDTTATRTAFLASNGGTAQGSNTSGTGAPGRNAQGGAPSPGEPGSPSPSTGSSSAGVRAGSGGPGTQ